eukprot:jgi/Mesvir1/19460/Mv10486-RA.1
MAAHLVETSDEDPTLTIARFIGELTASHSGNDSEQQALQVGQYVSECEALMVEGRTRDLLLRLYSSLPDIMRADVAEKDAECAITVIFNLLRKMPPQEAEALVVDLCNELAANTAERQALRLSLMFSLFNSMSGGAAPRSCYPIFMCAMNYAYETRQADQLVPSFKQLESWMSRWQLPVEAKRQLYLKASHVCASIGGVKDSFHFLVAYLSLFEGEEPPALASVREEAVRAALLFVGSQELFSCDLLDKASIRQLEKDAKYAPVHRLLAIFLTGRLDDYLSFYKEQRAALAPYNLSHDDAVTKMRLLSLAALGADKSAGGEVPYAVVRDTLQIEEGEVEEWVVRAISARLLEARMDQKRQVVIISRCTHRVFGPAQWKELQANLALWKVRTLTWRGWGFVGWDGPLCMHGSLPACVSSLVTGVIQMGRNVPYMG